MTIITALTYLREQSGNWTRSGFWGTNIKLRTRTFSIPPWMNHALFRIRPKATPSTRWDWIIQDGINKCHLLLGLRFYVVKESREAAEHLITYSGYFPSTVTFLRSIQESGTISWNSSFWICVEKKSYYADERAEVPIPVPTQRSQNHLDFNRLWGILLVGASLVFLADFLLSLLIFLSFIASELTNVRLHFIR